LLDVSGIKATFQIQEFAGNGSAVGSGIALKMETFPRISCVQYRMKFQEFQ
jgi:hypothetical protein